MLRSRAALLPWVVLLSLLPLGLGHAADQPRLVVACLGHEFIGRLVYTGGGTAEIVRAWLAGRGEPVGLFECALSAEQQEALRASLDVARLRREARRLEAIDRRHIPEDAGGLGGSEYTIQVGSEPPVTWNSGVLTDEHHRARHLGAPRLHALRDAFLAAADAALANPVAVVQAEVMVESVRQDDSVRLRLSVRLRAPQSNRQDVVFGPALDPGAASIECWGRAAIGDRTFEAATPESAAVWSPSVAEGPVILRPGECLTVTFAQGPRVVGIGQCVLIGCIRGALRTGARAGRDWVRAYATAVVEIGPDGGVTPVQTPTPPASTPGGTGSAR